MVKWRSILSMVIANVQLYVLCVNILHFIDPVYSLRLFLIDSIISLTNLIFDLWSFYLLLQLCKCSYCGIEKGLPLSSSVHLDGWKEEFFFYPEQSRRQHRRGSLQPQSSQLLQNPRRPVWRKAIMWQRWGDSQGFQSRIVNLERTTSGEVGSGGDSGG